MKNSSAQLVREPSTHCGSLARNPRLKLASLPLLQRVALLAFLVVTACGGPLAHTVKMNDVPQERREEVVATKDAVRQAEQARLEAKDRTTQAKNKVKSDRNQLKEKKSDLKIARAQLDVEKAMKDADRDAAIASAQGRVKLAQVELAIAEAQLSLSEEEAEHADRLHDEAKAEWHVALAEHELIKSQAIEPKDAQHTRLHTKIVQQRKDKQTDLDKAKKRSEKSAAAVAQAKAKLTEVRDE